MTAGDRHTHHDGDIRLMRVDGVRHATHSPDQSGAVAWWADGSTSYLLHTRTDQVHGVTLADEMDTVIQFVDRIRLGETIEVPSLEGALEDIRRLRTRLEAIENEAILYAREQDPTRTEQAPRLSFPAIAARLDLSHTTVIERHQKMADGQHAAFRPWLVKHTSRDTMYRAKPVV